VSKLDEFKIAVRRTITSDDVIKAMLSQVNTNHIAKDPERIHSAIYTLKNKHKRLLAKFEFDSSGLTPFSDSLDRVLFRLETATILGSLNPSYLQYELSDDTKQMLKDSLNKFPEKDRKILAKLGQEFEQLVRLEP